MANLILDIIAILGTLAVGFLFGFIYSSGVKHKPHRKRFRFKFCNHCDHETRVYEKNDVAYCTFCKNRH